MFCAACGSPLTQSLSFCNRCGADLRERDEPKNTGAISAFLSAITVLGVFGLVMVVAGALALRTKAGLAQELVGFFMLCTFLIIGITETMLIRQLSRLIGSSARKKTLPGMDRMPFELGSHSTAQPLEPVASVTDGTTRTLEFSGRQQ